MKKYLIITLLGLAALSGSLQARGKVTMGTVLDEMCNIAYPAEYPVLPYRTMMTSSHDRRSKAPGDASWFANADGRGFIRMDVNEKVLFDENHPGVITRIWITTKNPRATLRFYFDGEKEPRWVMEAFDFTETGLDGLRESPLLQVHPNYEKGRKGGQTFFLPIPYAKSCKITLEEPDPGAKAPARYYQIEHRRYPDGTPVETFTPGSVIRYSRKIRETARSLQSGTVKGKVCSAAATLRPGEALVCTLPAGSRAVTELTVSAKGLTGDSRDKIMRELILSATFDGAGTVNVPLSDFSGSGMGTRQVHCRQMEADGNGTVTSRWVMPYRKEAVILLSNTSGAEVKANIQVRTRSYAFGENTLYFHATWKEENGLPVYKDPTLCREWNRITIQGRGIYAGDNLTLFNHSPAWYGEGDEKIYFDGEAFPSVFGTGTEDYFNCSWAPVHVFHTPWGGAPRADEKSSHGHNTFLRTRMADVLLFRESLRFDLELISWKPGTVDYASTVYWYGDLSAFAK